jgi:hypothetical protein
MSMQIDYIVAAGIFILVVGSAIYFATNNLTNVEDEAKLMKLKAAAQVLLSGEFDVNISQRPDLFGDIRSFYVLVNNTKQNYLTGEDAIDLEAELVVINFSTLGFDYNINSTYIDNILYEIVADTVRFNISLNANESKWVRIYFDETNFTSRTKTVAGVNNLTERIYPVYSFPVVKWNKLLILNQTDYTEMKKFVGFDFNLTVYGAEIFSYGSSAKKGDVVALEKPVLVQNSSGSITDGRVVVQVW